MTPHSRNGEAGAKGRIAIVIPWFGPDLRGGAEQQAWQLAEQLADRGHEVDVLTTCCRSFDDDWARNSMRPGRKRVGKLTIRRFKVSKRDRRAFERVNSILLSLDVEKFGRSVNPIGDEDAQAFYDNTINSQSLYAYLALEGQSYDNILFLPYLYGPTLLGLPLVAERAFLQPCLHDEPYAYLTRVAATAHAAKGLLFNSEGEYELALRLFGPGIAAKSTIVGEGVSQPLKQHEFTQKIGGFVPADESYVLYLGRQDPGKNIATLIQAFTNFKRNQPTSRTKLVLAGERPVSYGDSSKDIVDVGPVSESEKAALLAHCRILAQPSKNESFSRVIYEAWLQGRPVIVHRACLPTMTAVSSSRGGYIADSTASWEAALSNVEFASLEELAIPGERGRAYAQTVSSWPSVIERYESVFSSAPRGERPAAKWDDLPDLALAAALQDGKINLVYAGPIVRIDHLNDLLLMFLHFATIAGNSRLTILATGTVDNAIYAMLCEDVRRLDLVDRVLVATNLTVAQQHAIYRSADIFVSLDRSGTSGDEFIEAMWFDIPILAFATATTTAAIGGAAMLVKETDDYLALAVLAHFLVTDESFRAPIVHAQRARRNHLAHPQREQMTAIETGVPWQS